MVVNKYPNGEIHAIENGVMILLASDGEVFYSIVNEIEESYFNTLDDIEEEGKEYKQILSMLKRLNVKIERSEIDKWSEGES